MPWWYLTSPVPPWGMVVTASSVDAPSNSAKIVSYARPRLCESTFSRPLWAIPTTTSWRADARRELDQLVEHRDRHVQPLDRELMLAEVGLVHEPLQRIHLDEALEQRRCSSLLSGWRYAPDSMCSRSQTRWRWEAMCSISYAIVPQ